MKSFQIKTIIMSLIGSALVASATSLYAGDHVNKNRLPESASPEALRVAAVFNFTKKGCLPSPAISNTGEQEKGLEKTGSNTGECQRAAQLDFSTPQGGSNTYHRAQCLSEGGVTYCAHMYALYFLKDQPVSGSGHPNDWEWAMVWTTSRDEATPTITYGAHSYHHDVNIESAAKLAIDSDAHLRFVYDQTGGTTHTMYFYPRSTGNFFNNTAVTPTVVDWYTMSGSGVSNSQLKEMLNTYDYGRANCSVNDKNFANNIARAVPKGYPSNKNLWATAVQESINAGEQKLYYPVSQ